MTNVLNPRRAVLAVAAAAAVITAAFVALPPLRFAYDALEARVALETGTAFIALVASYLMLGRFLSGRRADSLALATGLAVLASTHVLGVVLLALGPPHDWRFLSAWGAFAGSLLFAVAALVPMSRFSDRRFAGRDVAGAAVLVVAVSVGLLLLELTHSPAANGAPLDTRRPDLETNSALLVAEIGSMLFYAIAAAGFSRRTTASDDRFLGSLAVGSTLGAFARLHYVLFAPTATGYVRTGDVLRVLFYGALLVGAGREIGSYWRSLAEAAVLEERRRIARDLHDGVAQELAFIGRRAQRLDAEKGREIAAAAERALNDSRRSIAALTRPLDRSLSAILAEALDDVAARHGVGLDLHLTGDVDVDPAAREALTRIACEAVANAARHGGAETVRVELSGGDRVRFAVTDAGCGFDVDAPVPGRYGLTIMRERAEAVGASFRVASEPGSGTTVEVKL